MCSWLTTLPRMLEKVCDLKMSFCKLKTISLGFRFHWLNPRWVRVAGTKQLRFWVLSSNSSREVLLYLFWTLSFNMKHLSPLACSCFLLRLSRHSTCSEHEGAKHTFILSAPVFPSIHQAPVHILPGIFLLHPGAVARLICFSTPKVSGWIFCLKAHMWLSHMWLKIKIPLDITYQVFKK